MSALPESATDLSRRVLLRRGVAASLLAIPTVRLLAACAGEDTPARTDPTTGSSEGPEVPTAGVLLTHHAQGLTDGIRALRPWTRDWPTLDRSASPSSGSWARVSPTDCRPNWSTSASPLV
jgi:hypothetical protein